MCVFVGSVDGFARRNCRGWNRGELRDRFGTDSVPPWLLEVSTVLLAGSCGLIGSLHSRVVVGGAAHAAVLLETPALSRTSRADDGCGARVIWETCLFIR